MNCSRSHPCFVYDRRLGIRIPLLEHPFETYSIEERLLMIEIWEEIRGTIPTKVMELEQKIEIKLSEMAKEEDFNRSCKINNEIAELASCINDLHIWYRTTQDEPLTNRHM